MFNKVALVTGANKGIGFAIVKRLCERFDGIVYLTSRDEARGRAAAAALHQLGLRARYHQLDVADRDSVRRLSRHLASAHGGLDILVNNAAVVSSVIRQTYAEDKTIIDINYKAALTLQEFIYPLVRDNGRILHIASNCGHLSNIRNKFWIERLSRNDLKESDINAFVEWYLESSKTGNFKKEDLADNGSIAAYRVSKVALSALTIVQQRNLLHRKISVNCVHPGMVRTDLTSGIGMLTADEAADTPVYLVLDAPPSLRGAYVWCDRTVLDWHDYNANYYFKISQMNSWVLPSIYSKVKIFFIDILLCVRMISHLMSKSLLQMNSMDYKYKNYLVWV